MQGIVLTVAARRRISWLLFVVAALVGAAPTSAFAADPNVEAAAKALQKKAIEEDNLNVNYAGAVKKLQTAIQKCDGDKCDSALKAALHRDLGAMQILNGSVDEGKASFGQALGFEPSIELDPAYKNAQLESVFSEVKKKGGGGAGGAAGGAPVKAGPQPTGDFTHTPAPEGLVRTPLPIYVEYSGDQDLARVTVKYKGFGMADWKTLELKKSGDSGFGEMIPCKDVTQGLMQYYIQGFNDKNDAVASGGTRAKPYSVAINNQISGPAPSLPGEEPPAQCADSGECPPDFPGCASNKKKAGDDCAKDDECASGTCSNNKCAGKKGEGEECDADDDCDSDKCTENKCAASSSGPGKYKKLWIGAAIAIDLYFLPGESNVCKVDGKTGLPNGSYQCVDSNGNAFPNAGATINGTFYKGGTINGAITGNDDQVIGGIPQHLSNIRLLLSFDYALSQNFLIGARAGYVANTMPGASFPPMHLEARGTYLIGKNALTKTGLVPMLFFGAGAGEFDGFVQVSVDEDIKPTAMMTEVKGTQKVDAWAVGGPFFFDLGAGLRFNLSPGAALFGAAKFEAALGGQTSFLAGVAPELGVVFGL